MRQNSAMRTLTMASLGILGWPLVALLPTNAGAQDMPPPVAAMIAPLAAEATVLDALQLGDGMIIAVGDRGHILRSTDEGASWQQSPAPVSILLTTIDAAADGTLLAAGHDAVILRSTDEGASWEIVHREPEWEQPILDLHMISATHGFAIGAYGLYLETDDGGMSWTERSIYDGDSHLYASARLRDGSLLIAGEFGTLLRSEDEGATWAELDSPYGGTFFGLTVPPADEGAEQPTLVYGLQGHVFASTDYGASWTAVDTGVENGLYNAIWSDGTAPILLGHGGLILIDRDTGPGFDWQSVIRPARKPLAGGLKLDDGRYLIYGETGLTILDLDSAS